MEEENNKGETTHHFCQAIEEARNHVQRYSTVLMTKSEGTVEAIDYKKAETGNIMTEIEKTTNNIAKAKFGTCQASWVRKLRTLKPKCQQTRTTSEEMDF